MVSLLDLRAIALFLIVCAFPAAVVAQKSDEPPPNEITGKDFPRGGTRDLTGQTDLISSGSIFVVPKFRVKKVAKRPPAAPHKPVSKTKKLAPAPDFGMPITKPAPDDAWQGIGVTVWRMERATKSSTGTRMLVQNDTGTRDEWVPKRVPSDSIFSSGDLVRLSIESPRDGYLYVFDREIRKHGAFGEPYQIFPTATARGGDNRVRAGVVIDIPAQSDAVPVFTLKPVDANSDWQGEMLTIIVSPKPIRQLPTLTAAGPIPLDVFEALEEAYSRDVVQYEQDGSEGSAYTKAEKEAGSGTRQLTQVDPYPQTVYRVKTAPGQPMITWLPLKLSQR